jgi:hypothetical protein
MPAASRQALVLVFQLFIRWKASFFSKLLNKKGDD